MPTQLSGCVIIEDGELLLLYRRDEEHWEVPGGKVEGDESPTGTAVREAEEEIGVTVELEKPFFSGEFMHRGELYLWHGYLAKLEGDPELREEKFSEMKWFSREDLKEVELAPNLQQILPGLRRLLG